MNTQTLIEAVKTRIESGDNNPTRRSFLYEIVKALEELQNYQENDKTRTES